MRGSGRGVRSMGKASTRAKTALVSWTLLLIVLISVMFESRKADVYARARAILCDADVYEGSNAFVCVDCWR